MTTTTAPTVQPYSYLQFIKSPSEMGMSDAGNLKTIESNINGLVAYVDLLIDGPSKASKASNNGPLGNQFFVQTNASCNTSVAGIPTSVSRSIYVNNIPKGGIGSAPGANSPDFRGLIPGMMSGMEILDPARIADSITNNSGTPDCISVTLNVMDSSYNTVPATNYVTVADARYIDPCSFTSYTNPTTNGVCSGKTPPTTATGTTTGTTQAFTNRTDLLFSEIEDDYASQAFLFSFGILSIYLLHQSMKKLRLYK